MILLQVNARNPCGVRTLKIILLEMVSWISEPICFPLEAYRSSLSVRVTLMIRPLMIWGVSHWISPFIIPEPPIRPIWLMDRGKSGDRKSVV